MEGVYRTTARRCGAPSGCSMVPTNRTSIPPEEVFGGRWHDRSKCFLFETKDEASASNTDKSTDQFVLNVSSKPEEDTDVTIVHEITPEDKETENQDFKCLQKLSENLKELYVGSKDFDLTLKVKDKEFKAHKVILGTRSPVFNAMLSHNLSESKEGIITIEDCEPEVFDEFLLFIYAGRVQNLSSDNVCGLYYAADKYDLPELKDKCIHFLKKSMSPETICDVISLATKHSEREFLNLAVQFFVDNLEKILVTVSWQLYLKENPIQANELYIKALNLGFTRKR